jgi:hypothetical protein
VTGEQVNAGDGIRPVGGHLSARIFFAHLKM